MNRQISALGAAVVFSLMVAVTAYGSQHHDAHGAEKSKDHAAMGHGAAAPAASGAHTSSAAPGAMAGHAAMSGTVMLGEATEAGVTAMAHIADVGAAMAAAGRKENHHLMVMFRDAAGKPVSEGTVALRLTAPGAGEPAAPMALVAMAGQFGADLALTAKGLYRFEIGTKLADGVKRQFAFSYEVK